MMNAKRVGVEFIWGCDQGLPGYSIVRPPLAKEGASRKQRFLLYCTDGSLSISICLSVSLSLIENLVCGAVELACGPELVLSSVDG